MATVRGLSSNVSSPCCTLFDNNIVARERSHAVCIGKVHNKSTRIAIARQYKTDNAQMTHCNTLQHAATHCNALQHTAIDLMCSPSFLICVLSILIVSRDGFIFSRHIRSTAVCCSVLQCVAVCCSVLQCVAVCCSALQCVICVLSILIVSRWLHLLDMALNEEAGRAH